MLLDKTKKAKMKADEIVLDELRRIYERRKTHWHSLDSKISSFLQTSSMILTVLILTLQFFHKAEGFQSLLFVNMFSIVVIVLSIGFAVYSVKLKKLEEISLEVDTKKFDTDTDGVKINKLLINQYQKTISNFDIHYEKKSRVAIWSQILLILGVILFGMALIVFWLNPFV